MVKFYEDFNSNLSGLLNNKFGGEGFIAKVKTSHINVKGNASIKDATSNISSKLSYKVNENVDTSLTVSTPHHYLLKLTTDFKDRFKDSAAKLTGFKIEADLECDEHTHTYPTTFHSNLKFNNLAALHTQVMTEKGNNLQAQLDIYARIYKQIYGGGEVIYDDKAKSLILSKYGLFYKFNKDYNLALEYSQEGDLKTVQTSVFHEANPNTSVGSRFVLDLDTQKIGVTTAVQHKLDEATTLKARVDNLGTLDLAVTSRLSENLKATFSTGMNASGVLHGKTHDESYSGLQFSFNL